MAPADAGELPAGARHLQHPEHLSADGWCQGDIGLADWTYDLFLSQGESRTNTEYVGYISMVNYNKILTAPNFGQGFREESLGLRTRC